MPAPGLALVSDSSFLLQKAERQWFGAVTQEEACIASRIPNPLQAFGEYINESMEAFLLFLSFSLQLCLLNK